jgi:hypothetical protein
MQDPAVTASQSADATVAQHQQPELPAAARAKRPADSGGTLAVLAALPVPKPLVNKKPRTEKSDLMDVELYKTTTEPQALYLPSASMEQLADSYANVQGVRLPLHSQVLSTY